MGTNADLSAGNDDPVDAINFLRTLLNLIDVLSLVI